MLATLEAGEKLTDQAFEALQPALRQQLLVSQLDLAGRDYPVIVLVAGFDGAGKGTLAHRLTVWMDPRHIDTNAFWMHSDEEDSRPYFWRFWRKLPARGEMGIFLGAWYTQLLYGTLKGKYQEKRLTTRLEDIASFERMLTDDGVLLIKLWLHVSREAQRLQLDDKAPGRQQNPSVRADSGYWWKHYEKAVNVAERIILATNAPAAPWHIMPADDRNVRESAAGRLILEALQSHAQRERDAAVRALLPDTDMQRPNATVGLASVDLSAQLSRKRYRKKLVKHQHRLEDLAWRAYQQKKSLVVVFEGWDAAGKGSDIRRVTAAMDPRLYNVLRYAAPSEEERAHHYLWRFWRHLERDGRATLFDRSWYGRVLVERVEQFATQQEWQRAYREINQFERQLVDHGSVVVKFWLHLSQDEQLRRFRDREQAPHKQYKMTPDDWRNRDKRAQYEQAVNDMVSHTSTAAAPWNLIAGDDKRYARIQILKILCRQLSAQLER